jgi:hypothetical protein
MQVNINQPYKTEINMDNQHEITDENTANNMDTKTVKYAVEGQEKPLLKDAKTGKFIKGTGHSGKGGRKKGSKDRVSQAMVDLATELVADRGAELFHEMADRDPAQALALVAKIISPEELRAVYAQDRAEEKNTPQDVTIRLVSAPSPRLSDTRSQDDVDARQRGLTAPVERLIEPSEDAVVATQDEADEEAVRAERERVRRQNELLKEHGELVGRRPRSAAPDTLPYPDDPSMI